jgi:hypothetical protein
MDKVILSLMVLGTWVCLLAVESNTTKQKKEDIKEKALFKGRAYYDERLKKQLAKKDANRSQKPVKIYKRKDGSIDSFKTYDEAKKR